MTAAAAADSIRLANNGYADIGPNDEIAAAVRAMGFIVIRSTNLHGRPTWKGYTPAAQAWLAAEHAAGSGIAESTYKPSTTADDGIDWKAAILDRQEAYQRYW
jgi:hypothetical protein